MNDYITIRSNQLVKEETITSNKNYVLGIKLPWSLNVVLALQLIYKEAVDQNEDINTILYKKWNFNLFIEDVDYSKDGSSHYINYISKAWDKEDGLFMDKKQPIYSSPIWKESIIIWYKGTIVGKCIRKWAYLSYDTLYECNWFFKEKDFAKYDQNCLHLAISKQLFIPINPYYEKLWGIKESERYIFWCQFGYDWWWGDPNYAQFAKYLYISWIIIDEDFNPCNGFLETNNSKH